MAGLLIFVIGYLVPFAAELRAPERARPSGDPVVQNDVAMRAHEDSTTPLKLNGFSRPSREVSADGAYKIVARALRSGAEVARATVQSAPDTASSPVNEGSFSTPTAPGGFRVRPATLGPLTDNTGFAAVDGVPLAPSRPDLIAADDSGLSSLDNVTFVARPRFSVTTSAGLVVELVEAGTVIGSAIANNLGVATVQVDLPLADGTHAVSARARLNATSNPSPESAALSVRIDTVAPSAPVLALRAGEDSGLSVTDNTTNVALWHIYASLGDAVQVPTHELAPNGREVDYAAVPAFVFLPDTDGGLGPDNRQGTWTYQAFGVDIAGNKSARSNVLAITFDSITPAAPVLDVPDREDSGASNTDNLTNVDTLHIYSAVDDAVSLPTSAIAPDGNVVSSTTAPAGAVSPTQQGTWTYHAHGIDLAGNLSATSEALSVTIDSTTPTGTLVVNDDAAGTRDPNVGATLSFTDALDPFELRFSTDGGLTWSEWQPYRTELSVLLPEPDGVKTVSVEVRDRAGNVGSASDDILLDSLGPALSVTSPAAGAMYDVAQNVAVALTGVDPSGVRSTSVTLDGKALDASTIDTFLLAVGFHKLAVTAADNLGNVSSRTLTFEIRATIDGLAQATRRAIAAGLVERGEGRNLLQRLQDAARELSRGDEGGAAKKLRKYADSLLDEAGDKVNRAFARRAADWALDLASRMSPRTTLG